MDTKSNYVSSFLARYFSFRQKFGDGRDQLLFRLSQKETIHQGIYAASGLKPRFMVLMTKDDVEYYRTDAETSVPKDLYSSH